MLFPVFIVYYPINNGRRTTNIVIVKCSVSLNFVLGPVEVFKQLLLSAMFDVEAADTIPQVAAIKKANLSVLEKRDALRPEDQRLSKLLPIIRDLGQFTKALMEIAV